MNYNLKRLEGEHVVLIPTSEVGLDKELRRTYRDWLNNDQEVREGIGETYHYTDSDIDDLFNEYMKGKKELHFIIYLKTPTGLEPIGDISVVVEGDELTPFNESHRDQDRIGYLKIMLGRERGKGYGTEAAKLLFDYLFNEQKFDKIFSSHYSDNEASRRLHEKLGFNQLYIASPDGREEMFLEITREKYKRQKDKN
ncbi:MAG: GNAT family N-acetyltransferase [Candidatus Aenigmarchaeota archaeon]|nr:GNAT family N-acetyltransferase [Candidatus Aenigmarchaeota archaeon]